MATVTRSSFIIPELLADAISVGFTGVEVMFGSPAVVTNPTLPTEKRGGDVVKVPYFGNIGEFDDVAENVALVPAALTSSSETAAVARSGKAIEITKWAQIAAAYADPYAELAKQMIAGFQRRAGKALIDAAKATLPAGMTKDVYNATTPRTMDYDLVIDGKLLWGDEQDDQIAMMVVHSKVFGDMLKLKDSLGRPLLTDPVANGLRQFAGIPIYVTDRLAATAGKHDTLLLKRGALALWFNASPFVETDKDILKHTELTSVHIYYVAYRYKNLPGLTKGGVALLQHN